MQIVIDIPEDVYKRTVFYREFRDLSDCLATIKALEKATPLPKGHGRLIDEERISLSGIHFETERDHAMMIGRLNSAPTIIEAERGDAG